MFYIQAGVNQSTDHFTFDVTNGITWLRGLSLKIIIIPEHLYMQTKNVSVEEGKSVKLEAVDIVPTADYYRGKIFEYRIMQQPAFGDIRSELSKVNRFTHKQLESGSIFYVHDGSENATDSLRLIAIARNKESVLFDLFINVIQVNDQEPKVVTNTGLQIWIGGRTSIRPVDLSEFLAFSIEFCVQFFTFFSFFSGARLRHAVQSTSFRGAFGVRWARCALR